MFFEINPHLKIRAGIGLINSSAKLRRCFRINGPTLKIGSTIQQR